MNKIINSIKTGVAKFARDEEGAQIVEYALIIAVVSIALVVLLRGLTTGTTSGFGSFITRVSNCLTGAAACS